jgi:cholesterol transport system auxiliary component
MTLLRTSRVIPVLFLAAALGGCLGAAPPVPRDHFYRILVPPPQAEAVTFPGTVSVDPIEAQGLLRERPLLFSVGSAQEVQQHDYHYWTDAPPRMLQLELVDYLRKGHAASAVITPDLRMPADYEVSGRIKRLERILDGKSPRVVAELELAMTETGTNRLVVVQTYNAEIKAADDSVTASVQALDQALSDIFGRFVADAGKRYLAQRAARGD